MKTKTRKKGKEKQFGKVNNTWASQPYFIIIIHQDLNLNISQTYDKYTKQTEIKIINLK